MNKIRLETVSSSHSITVFWEKPEEAAPVMKYQVTCGGAASGITDRTHFTIDGLKPDTLYEIMVEGTDCAGTVGAATGAEMNMIDITKAPYNAAGDGKTMNTAAIQKALDECTEKDEIYFPAGIYLSGALKIHSSTSLYIEKDAVLQGTDVPDDYLPKVWSRFEGKEQFCYSSFLNIGEVDHEAGYTTKDIILEGHGTIASGGQILGKRIIDRETGELKEYLSSHADEVRSCETEHTIAGRVRPRLIQINNTQNVVISGLTLKNGACWNVHMIYSDNIVTHDCRFVSEGVWNGDGWDPDSSTNCTLFHSVFHTGDDAVAIKSGKNPEGNIVNRPSEHIRIFDCFCELGHGIAMGSEMSGGINDVKVWDCDMSQSCYGIEIKGTPKRGGYVRNLFVQDCKVPRICMHSVGYNDDGEAAPEQPYFSDCIFRRLDILCEYHDIFRGSGECEPIELVGFTDEGHEIDNVLFEDILIGVKENPKSRKLTLGSCRNVTFRNITVV